MGYAVAKAVSALSALEQLGSVTRGHPRSSALLPCARVRQSGQRILRSYDDRVYLTQYELTIDLFSRSMDELDLIEEACVDALSQIGCALRSALEQTGGDVMQKTLYFTMEH